MSVSSSDHPDIIAVDRRLVVDLNSHFSRSFPTILCLSAYDWRHRDRLQDDTVSAEETVVAL